VPSDNKLSYTVSWKSVCWFRTLNWGPTHTDSITCIIFLSPVSPHKGEEQVHAHLGLSSPVQVCTSVLRRREDERSGNPVDLYSGGAPFESRSGHRQPWGLSWFLWARSVKWRDSTANRPRPLPWTAFQIHLSSILLPFVTKLSSSRERHTTHRGKVNWESVCFSLNYSNRGSYI
jgi:hypothetical protein